MKNSKQAIIVFHTGKRLYHLPTEISGKSPRNFWSNGKRPGFIYWGLKELGGAWHAEITCRRGGKILGALSYDYPCGMLLRYIRH